MAWSGPPHEQLKNIRSRLGITTRDVAEFSHKIAEAGIEKNSLDEYLLQPIRYEMMRRGVLFPLRPLQAPQDRDKDAWSTLEMKAVKADPALGRFRPELGLFEKYGKFGNVEFFPLPGSAVFVAFCEAARGVDFLVFRVAMVLSSLSSGTGEDPMKDI